MYFMYNNDQYGFHIDLQDFLFLLFISKLTYDENKFQNIKTLKEVIFRRYIGLLGLIKSKSHFRNFKFSYI